MALILNKGELDAVISPTGKDGGGKKDNKSDYLNARCRAFIDSAPFACLATSDRRGIHHLAPLGGKPGFAEVLDDRTILLPEWPAPESYERLSDLLEDGQAGILFLAPGEGLALEVTGSASLSNDPRFLNHFRTDDGIPEVVILLEVRTSAFVGAMAIKRSGIWTSPLPPVV